jgi:hypothetical protein
MERLTNLVQGERAGDRGGRGRAILLWCVGALFVLPTFSAVGFLWQESWGPSKETQARLGLEELASCVRLYRIETGSWPDSLDALPPDAGPLKDPWGRPLRYRHVGSVAVLSLGRDGRASDDDLVVTIDEYDDSAQPKEEMQ